MRPAIDAALQAVTPASGVCQIVHNMPNGRGPGTFGSEVVNRASSQAYGRLLLAVSEEESRGFAPL